jgi:tRNA (guanine37-N1)-methyltransferase
MRFDVFTLFPDIFAPYLGISILQRAIAKGLLEVHLHDIRGWATDKHHVTDDTPYGGGGGMVMKPEPVFAAVEEVLGAPPQCPLILLTPQGRVFNQRIAEDLAAYPRLALLSGRYEGVDERVRQHLVTDEISIGDYVLTGGELPALIVMDAIARLLPGALGDPPARRTIRTPPACSNIRITPARPCSAAGPCPTCCCLATMPKSTAGAGSSRCSVRTCAAPTCSNALT